MLVSGKELKIQKLQSVNLVGLKKLASIVMLPARGNSANLIKALSPIPHEIIDDFIRKEYQELIIGRNQKISDTDLVKELEKVSSIKWGAVQGRLDQKIQAEYVRKYFRYDDLIREIGASLHADITSYVTASWYNHWSTILVEDHISSHPRVVPTLKSTFGVDIFFDHQPFDLKITYLPKGYAPELALSNPEKLAIWMYENQGAERFGADNRFFVILLDQKSPEESWRLKRDFKFVFSKIDKYLNTASVSQADELVFTFRRATHTAIAKVLLVVK